MEAVAEIEARMQRARRSFDDLKAEMARMIVGHEDLIEQVFIALVCGGHCLLEGVPGLGKTLMVRSLGEILSLSFSRIQFTPDLMPSDITGTDILEEDQETRQRHYRFLQGPIFSNIVLADDDDVVKRIKELLENYVKPAVEMDGGAIQFRSYNEGVVNLMLQGSCSGCPSSMITLKAGIEGMMKRMIPEVKEVVAEAE